MSKIELIKELRNKTGASLGICQDAVNKYGSDINSAIEFIQKYGISQMEKRGDREVKEGNIFVSINESRDKICSLVLKSETDFVSKNDMFVSLGRELTDSIIHSFGKNIDGEVTSSINDIKVGEFTIFEKVGHAVGIIKEKISIESAFLMNSEGGFFSFYIHGAHDKDKLCGKKCAIVELAVLDGEVDKGVLNDIGRKLCMHIVAFMPSVISVDGLDKSFVEMRKKEIQDGVEAMKKPPHVVDILLKDRVKKFYAESVLLEQPFLIDNSKTVDEFLLESVGIFQSKVEVKRFVYFAIGSDKVTYVIK